MSGVRVFPLSIITWLWQFKAKSVDSKRPPTRSKLSLNIGSRAITYELLWIVHVFARFQFPDDMIHFDKV